MSDRIAILSSFFTAKETLSRTFSPFIVLETFFTSRISFGGGCINDVVMHLSNDHLPFGGVGNSGIGNYHGKFGFDTFSHQKAILERATWGEPDLKYPPYSEKKLSWIKRVL